jgi:hypothetical protein
MSRAWSSPKDPDERLDYALDWRRELEKHNDSIFESYWDFEGDNDDQLVIESNGVKGYVTYVWLTGGTHRFRYTFRNRVHTTGGRIYERTVSLTIQDGR